jgi:hypothetical protein
MKKGLKRLLNAKIIFQIRHFVWVMNLVPVKNKNGEVHLCVDFSSLNKDSKKDNYPIPPMD